VNLEIKLCEHYLSMLEIMKQVGLEALSAMLAGVAYGIQPLALFGCLAIDDGGKVRIH
jgi:hypothetical protein